MMFPTPVSFIGAAAAVLSFSSMSNMVEMYHAVWKHKSVTETPKPSMVTKRSEWKSPDDALLNLQKMSRRELIQLYLECDKGDTAAFFGGNSKRKAYDGYLLDNGPVLVSESYVIMIDPVTYYAQFLMNISLIHLIYDHRHMSQIVSQMYSLGVVDNGLEKFTFNQKARIDSYAKMEKDWIANLTVILTNLL